MGESWEVIGEEDWRWKDVGFNKADEAAAGPATFGQANRTFVPKGNLCSTNTDRIQFLSAVGKKQQLLRCYNMPVLTSLITLLTTNFYGFTQIRLIEVYTVLQRASDLCLARPINKPKHMVVWTSR